MLWAQHTAYQITPICRVDVVTDVAGRHSCAYLRRLMRRRPKGAGRKKASEGAGK